MQLFARPQADVLDCDVAAGPQSREPDHLVREVDDLDRLAHVQHEDFAASVARSAIGRQGRGLQYQLDRLAHGHKKAGDLGVGHGQRPPGGELALEQRHDRPGRAQYVAETNRHIARSVAQRRPPPRLVEVERLAEALGEALGGAHDARRVDRFVGRDHHDEPSSKRPRGLGDVSAADDIGQHPLDRVGFDHRQVLQRRRMKDDLGFFRRDDLVDLGAVAHIAQQRNRVQAREPLAQFHLDAVKGEFAIVEQKQPAG